ncbi:MAG: App1 family protein [Geminicoccales bacterium]
MLARPVSAASSQGPFVLQPYRGYGSREEVFLIGRVFRQPTFGSSVREGMLGRQLIDIARGVLRHGTAGATLVARFCGAEQRVATDRDGYFRIHLHPARPPPADRLWHPVSLELIEPARVRAEGELFVPPATCRYVVISDIDDTVMYTGVASKAKMLWRLFLRGARSRVAFPGVAALLSALHRGRSGAELNPMLYVSRGPWSIYEVLDEFFNLHRIPIGPLLFLREWGLTLQRPFPRRAKDHKLELIRNMLALYRDLPFVLIGDSGQRDPEIYARIVREHPGRVLAIYIRNVSRGPGRHRAIGQLALEVVDAGSSLLLAADSLAMARHALEHGLVPPEALSEVREERKVEPDGTEEKPTRQIERPTRRETRRAVQQGELEEALDEGEENVSRNVVVELEEDGQR